MGLIRKFLVASIFLVALGAGASAEGLSPLSTWKNDRGSILTIWWVAGNQFQGTFTNFAKGFSCQGIPYQASGHTNPDGSLLFIVNFDDCNTVTTWRGRIKGPRIPTRWSLIYVDDETGLPHRLSGADVFTLQ